jgi:hypothetical protein
VVHLGPGEDLIVAAEAIAMSDTHGHKKNNRAKLQPTAVFIFCSLFLTLFC